MAGRNQHHIPQFFQRGFGVKRSGKPREIWRVERNGTPKLLLIKKTAAERDFYSAPSEDGAVTLDDKITGLETPLARTLAEVRARSVSNGVDPETAAELVFQLAPRSSHVRVGLEAALRHVVKDAADIFCDAGQTERVLGLDQDQPNERFREHLAQVLAERPDIGSVGLPGPVLERVAFYITKEHFEEKVAEIIPMFRLLFARFLTEGGELVRDSHNRALEQMDTSNPRRQLLAGFDWMIAAAPQVGAILPDCVALAREPGEPVSPLMFLGKAIDAVVMPLSSDKLLVGNRPGSEPFELAGYNELAAANSHDFFLASAGGEDIAALAPLIGAGTDRILREAVSGSIGRLLPASAKTLSDPTTEEVPVADDPATVSARELSLAISFIDCATNEDAERVGAVVQTAMRELSRFLPLWGLDGITFAGNYSAGLASVDRGIPGASPIKTAEPEVGTGIARMITVVRDGQTKGHIVLDGWIGSALIGEDEKERDWAVSVLVHQLALVAMISCIEEALPGTMLSPIDDPHRGRLYSEVDPALHAYVAAYICSKVSGSDDAAGRYRDLLFSALNRLKADVETALLTYRDDGDLDRLVNVALPAAGYVLQFAAELLATCAAKGTSVLDEDGELANALERCGLQHWLPAFGRDLEHFRSRLGKWESFDEFLCFDRHVERLLWAVGLFPWDSPEGSRVEVRL